MARKQHGGPWVDREPGRPSWYIYWYDAGRVRRRSTGTADRGLADEALGLFIIERARNRPAGPIQPPERYPVATALRWYAQEAVPALASAAQAGYAIKHLIKHFREAKVASLTVPAIRRYEKERGEKGIARGTIRRELAVLSRALSHAVASGYVTSAPKIALPAPGLPRTRHLDEDEIAALLDETAKVPHLHVWTMLALNTGARKSALLELTWTQVQFDQGLIYLNPEGREQTRKGRSTVPITDTLREFLREIRRRGASPFVVEYRGGRVLDIKKAFARACRAAGLSRVTPHTMRHTAGAVMARAGVDLHFIAKVLGHSETKTTELYAHLRPEWLREAMAPLGRVTGSRPSKRTS